MVPRCERVRSRRPARGSAPGVRCPRAAARRCSATAPASHRGAAVVGLRLLVDGVRHRPAAWGMPRAGTYAGGAAGSGGRCRSRRARPGASSSRWSRSSPAAGPRTAPLGRIEVVAAEPAARAPVEPGLIAICMATFEPDPVAVPRRRSSRCARRPTRPGRCVISDDCSSPERFAAIARGGRRRSALRASSRSERRLGFYRNFERALRAGAARGRAARAVRPGRPLVPREARGAARRRSARARLVYSDQRLVDARRPRAARHAVARAAQQPHRPRLAAGREHASPARRRCSAARWPSWRCRSPTRRACQFHDHWLGLVALAAGDVAYVDRPLYDYVQHRGAVFGEVTQRRRRATAPLRSRAGRVLPRLRPRARAGAGAARPLRARLAPRKRRALRALRRRGALARSRSRGWPRAAAAAAARPQRDARQRARARRAGSSWRRLAAAAGARPRRRRFPGPAQPSSRGGCGAGGRASDAAYACAR